MNEGHFLKLKLRIVPHGNDYSCRLEQKLDCEMSSPSGVCVLLSYDSLHGWNITNIYISSASLQAGPDARDVYLIPAPETKDRDKTLWIIFAAAYGPINAKEKWQM